MNNDRYRALLEDYRVRDKNEFRIRQERICADVPSSVVYAMDCWVKWMKHGMVGRGYPSKSAGFVSGGINCYDDFSDEVENYAALAVDGVVNSLELTPKTCIGIIWLGNTIHFRRIDVESVAKEAMRFIWRGLNTRGVV